MSELIVRDNRYGIKLILSVVGVVFLCIALAMGKVMFVIDVRQSVKAGSGALGFATSSMKIQKILEKLRNEMILEKYIAQEGILIGLETQML